MEPDFKRDGKTDWTALFKFAGASVNSTVTVGQSLPPGKRSAKWYEEPDVFIRATACLTTSEARDFAARILAACDYAEKHDRRKA